jgi:hypothetical protein
VLVVGLKNSFGSHISFWRSLRLVALDGTWA